MGDKAIRQPSVENICVNISLKEAERNRANAQKRVWRHSLAFGRNRYGPEAHLGPHRENALIARENEQINCPGTGSGMIERDWRRFNFMLE